MPLKIPRTNDSKKLKSGKQRKAIIKSKRRKKAEKMNVPRIDPRTVSRTATTAICNASLLAPYNSYGTPLMVTRGYYEDKPFRCKDCGKQEIWTATQQKWWYEIAKGNVDTTAARCRPCRRKERERVAKVRETHQEGLARKKAKGTLKRA